MNTPQTYLAAMTFPRFILALVVVVVHFGLHLPFATEGLFSEFFHNGAVSVSFFFFLSGVVLAYSYTSNERLQHFFLKRLARLYPIYILTFVVVLFSVLYLNGTAPTPLFGIINALGLQAWMPGYALQVNFPSWSLSVEFFFYALFPILHWIHQRLTWKQFTYFSLALFLIGLTQHILTTEFLYDPNRYYVDQMILYFPLFHLTTFTSGFYAGKLIIRLKEKPDTSIQFALLALVGIVGFITIMNTDNFWRGYAHNGGMIPFFLIICLGLALDRRIFPKLVGGKIFIYLGDISYGIYMWQYPVFLWYSHFVGNQHLSLLNFILYLLVLITIAAISFRVIEQPLRRRFSKNLAHHSPS